MLENGQSRPIESESVEPRPVEQLGENGLSHDYMNEITSLHSWMSQSPEDALKEYLLKKGIKKYEERFTSDKFKDVITPENQELVRQLDEKVDSLRILFDNFANQSINPEDFKEKFNQLYKEVDEIVRPEKYR